MMMMMRIYIVADWGTVVWFRKLDIRMSKHIQNIQQNHKLYHESHEKLESGIDSRKENSSKSKNPKRHIPERLDFTITICNSNQLHTWEVHLGLRILKIIIKDSSNS